MSEEAKIELELSEDEAMFLAVVLQHVGGSTKGPRGIADEVLAALLSELKDRDADIDAACREVRGGLDFR